MVITKVLKFTAKGMLKVISTIQMDLSDHCFNSDIKEHIKSKYMIHDKEKSIRQNTNTT